MRAARAGIVAAVTASAPDARLRHGGTRSLPAASTPDG